MKLYFRNCFSFSFLILCGFFLNVNLLAQSVGSPPILFKPSATNITTSSVTISAAITKVNLVSTNDTVTELGFCYTTDQNALNSISFESAAYNSSFTYLKFNGTAPNEGASYSLTITSLQPGITYYFLAYARNNSSKYYGYSATLDTSSSYVLQYIQITLTTKPTIITQPISQIINLGQSATLSVIATGSAPLAYQWFLNSNIIAGATGSTYTASSAGNYYVVVTNPVGPVTSSTVTITTLTSTSPVVLNTQVNATSSTTVTLVASINGGDSNSISARGFLLGTCSDLSSTQTLNLSSPTPISSFAFTVTNLSPGTYYYYQPYATNAVGQGRGLTLSFKTPGTNTSNLSMVNTSISALAGSGSASLTTGFTLAGTGNQTFLFRGVGPTLSNYSISGAMPDPNMTLYNNSTTLLSNDNWSSLINLNPVFTYTGAFTLPLGSKDSAIVISLSSGSYSIQLTPTVGTQNGIVLAEMYLVK